MKLKIGYQVYQIDFFKNKKYFDDGNPQSDDSKFYLGRADYIGQIIGCWDVLKKDAKQHTLAHEIVHVILFQGGYNELNDNELFVSMMADSILQIVKDNKKELIELFNLKRR